MEVYILPFLKRKDSQIGGVIVKHRKPDETPQAEDQDDPSAAIHACAHDLMKALEAKDVAGIAEALHSAFEILDSQPHLEGPHEDDHSYDAQNIRAAKED